MTLSGTGCLIDIDKLLATGKAEPAFDGLEEACGKACMDWYAAYYNVDWPHADDEETGLIPVVERSEPQPVYTLQGVRVGTFDKLGALPRGIYLIGGKKQIIR
jgi:hypothetical protein